MEFKEFLNALNLAKIGGKTISLTPTLTTSGTAYDSGDNVGGVLKLDGAVTAVNGTSILKSIVVKDNLAQSADLTILIFNQDPTLISTSVDNSAFAWLTSFPSCIGKFNIATADYESVDSKSIANVDTMSSPFQSSGTNNLWAVVITTGTPTYAANSTTLAITFNFLQD